MSIGGHQSAQMKNDEWLTPPEIVKALGPFDLDPCSPVDRPWNTAAEHYTRRDDGLMKPWHGMVWLNPPYGKEAARWLRRLANHGNGIAMIFARTETEMFRESVWYIANAVLFIYGRLHFYTVNGDRSKHNGGAPSVLVAYGSEAADRLQNSGIEGKFLRLDEI